MKPKSRHGDSDDLDVSTSASPALLSSPAVSEELLVEEASPTAAAAAAAAEEKNHSPVVPSTSSSSMSLSPRAKLEALVEAGRTSPALLEGRSREGISSSLEAFEGRN